MPGQHIQDKPQYEPIPDNGDRKRRPVRTAIRAALAAGALAGVVVLGAKGAQIHESHKAAAFAAEQTAVQPDVEGLMVSADNAALEAHAKDPAAYVESKGSEVVNGKTVKVVKITHQSGDNTVDSPFQQSLTVMGVSANGAANPDDPKYFHSSYNYNSATGSGHNEYDAASPDGHGFDSQAAAQLGMESQLDGTTGWVARQGGITEGEGISATPEGLHTDDPSYGVGPGGPVPTNKAVAHQIREMWDHNPQL